MLATKSVLHRPALFLLLLQSIYALNISVPLNAPSSAVKLSPSLLSFSIEQDRWTDWAGTTSRNEFFFNVLDNLKQLTGQPPQIRIGANSEDHTNYNPNVQFAEDVFPAPSSTVPYPEATNITVGDSYYTTAQFLPPNTHVIWGLNLGQNNLSAAYLEAKSLVKAFASSAITKAGIKLDAIQIGNEPDLYMNNGLRARTYNSTQYVKEWIAFATNVTAAVNLSTSSYTKLWGAGFAGSSHSLTGFSPQAIIDQGILTSSPGPIISTISQHRYSGSFCSGSAGLLQDLMTKSTIRSNLTDLKSDIAAVHAKGLDYVLGETNSYACHGAPGVSNSAGAALWTLDYLLFAPQIGISRVFFHQGIGFKYNLIQPIPLTRSPVDGTPLSTPLPAHVQPQYYAGIIAGEAIGSSSQTRSIELSIDHPRISGYAFYAASGKLSRVLLINSQAYFAGSSSPRGSVHVDLSLVASSGSDSSIEADGATLASKKMTVKRLSISHADDTSGLTWGGQTYETSDGRVSGKEAVQTVNVEKGVDVSDTEVVLISF